MPQKSRSSIKDVAELAGVSTATVSHVFSGKKRVNAELTQRVKRAAESLDYSVDRMASQLRSGRNRVIAVLVPDLEDLFLNRFVAKIEDLATSANYEVIISTSRNDPALESSRLAALFGWRPAGIIAVPCGDILSANPLEDIGFTPMVAADRIRPGSTTFDSVTIDNYGSGILTVEHLIANGARSILLLKTPQSLLPIIERIRAAREIAQRQHNLTIDVLEISIDPVQGADRFVQWLQSNPLPDAVVGLTNVTTLSALSAFAHTGINIPDDVLLSGYHDSLWMTARKTPITTIAQPVDEFVRCVWERLEHRMNGAETPPRHIVLNAQLIARASTQRRPEVQP
jgi:LacI family transcriptional regulator